MHISIISMYVFMYLSMYLCVYLCMHLCMYLCIYVMYLSVCLSIRLSTCQTMVHVYIIYPVSMTVPACDILYVLDDCKACNSDRPTSRNMPPVMIIHCDHVPTNPLKAGYEARCCSNGLNGPSFAHTQ